MSLRTGTGIRTMDASKKLDSMSTLPYGELEKVLRATISPASNGEIISLVVPEALGFAEIDNYDIVT